MTKVVFSLDESAVERLTALKVMAKKQDLKETLTAAIRLYEYFLTQQNAGNTIHVRCGDMIKEVTLT